MSDKKPSRGSDNNSNLGIVVELSLKFTVQKNSDAGIDLSAQNKLAFDIADTFDHVDSPVERGVHDEASVHTRQLEKKLNVVIQLLNSLLANQGGEVKLHSLKLSANNIEWDNAQFQNDNLPDDNFPGVEPGQNLLFDIYPASELPYPVKRCGRVANIEGSVISVNFQPLDPLNQERFEKWIFQLHRRSLQHKVQ